MKLGELVSVSPYDTDIAFVWLGHQGDDVTRRTEWIGDLKHDDLVIILDFYVFETEEKKFREVLTLSKHGAGWIEHHHLKTTNERSTL